MFDSLFYYTGVAVWCVTVVYGLPVLPLIAGGVQYKTLQKVESAWSERYYEDIEDYGEKKSVSYPPTIVSVLLSNAMKKTETAMENYYAIIQQYYYRWLPFTT
jgi:hypothetical protein